LPAGFYASQPSFVTPYPVKELFEEVIFLTLKTLKTGIAAFLPTANWVVFIGCYHEIGVKRTK
jgi:hypothetical protein